MSARGDNLRGKFAAEPGSDEEDQSDDEDGEAGGEGYVEVAVGVVDVVVADEVPAEEREDGEEAGGEKGEESGSDGEQERGEEAEVAEGYAEEFGGLGGGGHGVCLWRFGRVLGDEVMRSSGAKTRDSLRGFTACRDCALPKMVQDSTLVMDPDSIRIDVRLAGE